MFKLYVALAFLAVAAAKPSWPYSYTYPANPSVYAEAPVYTQSYVPPVSTYSAQAGYPIQYQYQYQYPVPAGPAVATPAITYGKQIVATAPAALSTSYPVGPAVTYATSVPAPVVPASLVAGYPTAFAWKK